MEQQPNIAKAIIAVMNRVKGIEKNMQVGSGNYGYKGVADQEVKKVIGDAMAANGLCILPIGVSGKTEVSRWQDGNSNKQSVFTEVNTRYLLLHDSGESIELEGYGHGVDAQDKGAGKATTYALKYTLLYTFLIPTGKIDDADMHNSNEIEAPANQFVQEVNAAIAKLANVTNADELKDFGALLPDHVKTDMRFRNAASDRKKSFPVIAA